MTAQHKRQKRQEAKHWEPTGQISCPLDFWGAGEGATRNKADSFPDIGLIKGPAESDECISL